MTRECWNRRNRQRGAANSLYAIVLGGLAVVLLLAFLLVDGKDRGRRWSAVAGNTTSPQASSASTNGELFMYCAAGMRYPMEEIAKQYEQEYGVVVQLQYGGSNTLLSQLELSDTGDLYLAGDASYIRTAQDKGLARESIPLAKMKPVIAVQKENPKQIQSINDLLKADVKVALGNPDAAAVGKKTRKLLTKSGQWEALQTHVTEYGVFKPTVNEVANDVKLGSVDAGIIWDSTVAQYDELAAIEVPDLNAGLASIEISILESSKNPTEALRFARYVGARDKGLPIFANKGFQIVEGDVWEYAPEIIFFAGSVNRRALEPILKKFEQREGVSIITNYNGCGILTAQMRTMRQDQSSGFPDAYMACDVYYLNTVKDWFQDDVNVSEAKIVLVVKKGNPLHIKGLNDLLRKDVRLVLGHPDQCTIGVLTNQLLEGAGILDRLKAEKEIPMKPSSAMLVPDVITDAVDVTVAYVTDTLGEADKVDVVPIDSPLAKAIQPYSIARSSEFKQLTHRLYDEIARSESVFESAGFTWRLDSHAADK